MDSRVRASPEQLSTLLEYMETHGDLARPLIGAQGRVRSDRLWADLTNILNSVGGGVTKTTEKWKKVWADWKSKTKKKGLVISQHSRGTGGGPASRQTLSAMDERVLAIMGALAVEGQASVEEIGFTRSQSAAQEDSLILQIVDETSHLPLPEEPQPSTSQLLPPPSSTTFIPTHTPRLSPVAPASPAAPAAPAPPAPAAPTTPRRRRPPATPPSARRRVRLISPATPQSDGSPGRPRLPARRRRQALTPFERAANEFAAVESRRLEMEDRHRSREHERDMRALEVEHERNEVFRAVVNIAQAWLDYYRSRDNTEPLNIE